MLISLDMLANLATLHVQAIGEVTAPILEERDIVSTTRNFNSLVNNSAFPQGYAGARGELEAGLGFKQLQGAVRDKTRAVLSELGNIQYTAFMLEYDSWGMADAVEEANKLWTLLKACNQPKPLSEIDSLKREVSDKFSGPLAGFQTPKPERDDQRPPDMPPLDTPSDVIELVRTFCRAWQRHVQRTLFGGRGLNYAIGQLKMELLQI